MATKIITEISGFLSFSLDFGSSIYEQMGR